MKSIELKYPSEFPQCIGCQERKKLVESMLNELTGFPESSLVESIVSCLPGIRFSNMSAELKIYEPIEIEGGSISVRAKDYEVSPGSGVTHRVSRKGKKRSMKARVPCPGLMS